MLAKEEGRAVSFHSWVHVLMVMYLLEVALMIIKAFRLGSGHMLPSQQDGEGTTCLRPSI